MNQKLRFFMLALLCAMLNVAWGQEVTLDLTDGSWGFPTSKVITATSYTNSDGYTITVEGTSGNGFRVYSSPDYFLFGQQGASITLPAFNFDVEKIEVVGRSGASTACKMNVFVGDVAVSEETTGCTGTNTYEITNNFQEAGNVYKLMVTSKHNAQALVINIYKKEGSEDPNSDKYYVAGSWTDPDWDDGKIPMTKKSDGTYTLANQELPEGAQFKIVKEAADGGSTTWYGGAADGETHWVTVDNHTDISLLGGNNGKNFLMTIAGKWTFIVDPTGETPKISVDGNWPEWEYYLLGDFNEWETSDSYKFSDAGSLNKPIKKGEKFKIYAKRGNEEKWYGAVSEGDFYVNAEYVNTALSLTTENGGENFYMNLSNKKPYWTLDFNPTNKTLVLSNYLSDIAVLPFEFDGGRNDIEGTPGLTTNGLGTDYTSSPKLKFTTANNMVVLHFDERPGILSYDIKGNSFEGTFEVQTSEDGENYTVLKTYTSISAATTGQHETFDNLGENVRYIKWLYKIKTSGNVALGNIKLEKYEAPQPYTVTITPDDNAEIFVFYQNDLSEPIQSGTEVLSSSPMLISVDANDGYKIESVTVTDAEGEAVEVTRGEDSNSWTFIMPSSNVTVACTVSYVDPTENKTYAKVTRTNDITDGNYLIVYNTGAISLAYDGSSNDKLATIPNSVEVEINDGKITTNANIYFTISDKSTIKSASGSYIGRTGDSNGVNYSEETAYTNTISIDDNGNAVILASGGAYLRYNSSSDCFRYYKSSSYTNQKAIQLYKEVTEEPDQPHKLTISDKATDGKTFFATLANIGNGNFVVPTGVTVSTVQVTSAGKIERAIIESGSVIPGTEAYLVESNAPGQYNFNPTEGEAVTLGANMLYPTVKGEYTTVPASVGTNSEFTFYKLSLNGNNDKNSVGFYYGVAGGEPFLSKNDNTAFLAVPKSTYNPNPANQGILINPEETDGIQSVATEQGNSEAYTLTGVRVQGHLQKGVYIINGRKQVIK